MENIEVKELDAKLERIKAIATIVIVAIINVLNVMGYAMDAEPYVNALTSVLSAVSIAYCWWKNQNVTPEATESQEILNALKAAKHAKEDAELEDYEG